MTPAKLLTELIERVCLNDLRGSRAAHAEEFFRSVQGDADRAKAAIDFAFDRLYDSIKGAVSKTDSGAVTVVRKRRPPLSKHRIKQIAADIRSKIVLTDFILPKGTRIMDATREECLAAGGWLHDLGLSLKPNQKVGSKHTEETLQRIYARQHK